MKDSLELDKVQQNDNQIGKKKKKIIKQTKPTIEQNKMGNTSLSSEFKSGKWKSVQTIGNRQVLQNIETHIQVQKHFAMSDFKSFDDRFKNTELYNWRKTLPEAVNIVKLYDFEIKEERFGIQQDQYVYTEKIHRLSQKAKMFSKPEAFLLILDLLTGLDVLFETFGLFNVDLFLIGLSEAGRGKVWVNENYARNTIDESSVIEGQSETSELVVVNNLVRLVRDKVYNENFMPEIEFPNNMYLKGAIQYLRAVRRDHALFRVDKIYLDRNAFKDYYDAIYKQYLTAIQPRTQPNPNLFNTPNNPLSPQPLKNIQTLPVPQQPKQLERQKSLSFMKIKNEPSQTLSSDSNSRSKKPSDNTITLTDFAKEQLQPIHHGKIHLKDMIEKQKISAALNEVQNVHVVQQFTQSGNNFFPNEKIINQPPKPPINQQRPPMVPNLPLNNVTQIPQMNNLTQQKIEENRAPQLNQRPIVPMIQMPQQHKGQQLIQRKIVEYRPLNSEQRQNIQQIMGHSLSNNQRLMPIQQIPVSVNPRPPVQQIVRQPFHPASQTLPFGVMNRPLENEAIYSQKMGLNNVMPKNFPQIQEQQFINNVELCESVIFDRGQIEQNMADL